MTDSRASAPRRFRRAGQLGHGSPTTIFLLLFAGLAALAALVVGP